MTTIEKIEKLLGIKFDAKRLVGEGYVPEKQNSYSGSEEHADRLRLEGIEIEDLHALFSLTGELSALTIVNSSLPNFSDLLLFNPYYLTLDGVTNRDNATNTKGIVPAHLKIKNMQLDAKSLCCFKKSNIGGFRQVEFDKCHLENIQYLNTIEQISYLILNKITFTYQPLEIETRSGIYRMSIYNSKFDDVSFIPFKNVLSHIKFGSCKIGSFVGLDEFPELAGIGISTDTQVQDKTPLQNKHGRDINCNIFRVKKPFDLAQILPLKKFVTSLDLDDFKQDNLPHLKEFKRISHLEFDGGNVNMEIFLPIAKQIKSIFINRASFFNHESLAQFINVTSFKLTNFSKGKKALQSYERIMPLKNQLTELEIYDTNKISDIHLLKYFKALESLKLNEISVKDALHVLQLSQLKKLQLEVHYRKTEELDLGQLTNLEYLILDTDTRCKGMEHLQKLKSLQLGSDYGDTSIEINSLPKLESLERLNITNYDQKIKHLSQFPNLKYLRIKGCLKLKLKTMKKLEVLDLDNSSINEFSKIETQPNLMKLNLSSQYNNIDLKEMHKFPNLRVLGLMETDVTDISGLEPLKKLEILDLYYTNVSDVHVINTLPNMKEINLATHSKVDLESQLDRPEIAVYVGLPTRYLSIWEEDEFGI